MTNLVEILKNAPKGLELYSPIYGEITLSDVQPCGVYIKCESISPKEIMFDEYGRKTEKGECLLFPSKEHKDWGNWQKVLFKQKHFISGANDTFLITLDMNPDFNLMRSNGEVIKFISIVNQFRFATKKEIEKFYRKLRKNGYQMINGAVIKLNKR